MLPLGFLFSLGKALLRHLGESVGVGWEAGLAVQVSQEIWDEWRKQKDEDQRRAELKAIASLTLEEFRTQAIQVLREVAGDLDIVSKKKIAKGLKESIAVLRQSFKEAGESTMLIPLSSSRDLAMLLTAGYKPPIPRVTLIQVEGPLKGRQFVFESAGFSIVGREKGCYPLFPTDKPHKTISRHHCLIDVNPPDIRVRDLGSMGGTFVNDELIGKRAQGQDRDEVKGIQLPECNLKHGDTLKLCKQGTAVFSVKISGPLHCTICGELLANEIEEGSARKVQCSTCLAYATVSRQVQVRQCVQCGCDVGDEVGAGRPGEVVCQQCRLNFSASRHGTGAPAVKGYSVLRIVGQGGMGSVWLARKENTGELAALKVMLPSVAADPRSVKRFLQEINITRRLTHPNLVRLIEAGYQRGTFFLALEYCDGKSVADLMEARGGTLPVDEAVELTLQVLEGLSFAHTLFGPGKGLVHRDLKPANLFLTGTGSSRLAKIGDYGLAKAFDDTGLGGLTRTGETAGTPNFMPRQQIHHFKDPTPDFDVWAMAASLYYMLTRRSPRVFAKGMDPWIAVLETDPVPIRKYRPTLSKKLAKVIDHALTEQPEIGFRTAAEFKEALEGVA